MYETESVNALEYHYSMLMDELRMDTFRRAIEATVKTGDIVLDLGCGTGILSLFACRAGASKVYALEHARIIHLAKDLARENGFDDRIVFIQDWSTNVELDEKVDVIVSETVGNFGFDEGILEWMIDARTRLLKEDGRIIPRSLDLVMAPSEVPDKLNMVKEWPEERYGIRFAPARVRAANNIYWTLIKPEQLLSEPMRVYQAALSTCKSPAFVCKQEFFVLREGALRGFAGWFRADLAPEISVSNAPGAGTTSWMQAFIPLEEDVPVSKGDQITLKLQMGANGGNWCWEAGIDQVSRKRDGRVEFSGTTQKGKL